MGRDLSYNPHSCELLAVGSAPQIYRLNLQRGQFMSPFETSAQALNVVTYNSHLGVVAVGGDEGVVQLWSSRERNCLISLPLISNQGFMSHYGMDDICALAFSKDSLSLALGDSQGKIKVYDLRYPLPLIQLQHQYQLPILNLKYHRDYLISADKKVIKLFNKDSGSLFCPFEPPNEINDFEVIPESGLFLTASQSSRMGVFYIPDVGGPPKWCSFLETLTEELEQESKQVDNFERLHGDYQFVTAQDMQEINAGHLVGTKLLRPFMHGFFIDRRLYEKLHSAVTIDEQNEIRKQKIKERLEQSRENRIVVKEGKEKMKRAVNQEYAQALFQSKEGSQIKAKVLSDPRFKKMWKSSEFKIDEESEAFKLQIPTKRTRISKQQSEVEREMTTSGKIVEKRAMPMNKRNQHKQDKKGRKSSIKRRVVISAWKL